ncbi:hypothetical protein [Halorubrum sp. AJ67]|uniref:hypothetical protein n=1 Tax=Halorubrum sp. AJ67 TaxID=1173487 RepID=UPI0003DCA8E7|nr:hypothetical protein [Halorubrum sp. AJ67]CDK39654.1 hypothetical protein BN903_53 [Halorubrum sp. AJ67]
MSDDQVECDYCGQEYDKRGIGAHEAHCDEATEEEMQPDSGASDLSTFEAEVRARDDGQCARCESIEALVVHDVDPDVEQERANAVTLCEQCEDELTGLHPLTKRTKIGAQ